MELSAGATSGRGIWGHEGRSHSLEEPSPHGSTRLPPPGILFPLQPCIDLREQEAEQQDPNPAACIHLSGGPVEAPIQASGPLFVPMAPLQAAIPQGRSCLCPLPLPHGGQETAPLPTQSLSSPPAPGPGQAPPRHLAGSAPCPSAHPLHPQSSGHASTLPSSPALLGAFPSSPSCVLRGARGPCGSVEEGVFCATSSHSGLNSKGVLLGAPLPAPPPSPRFLRAEVLAGFLPTFLLANMLLAPQKNQAMVSHFSGALMFLELLFRHAPG